MNIQTVGELKELLSEFPDDMRIEVQDEITSKLLSILSVESGIHRDPYDGDFDYKVVKIEVQSEE